MSTPTLPYTAGQRLALYAVVGSLGRAATNGLLPAILLAVIAAGGTASSGAILVASFTAVAALVGPVIGAGLDRLDRPKRGYYGAIALLASAALALAIGIGEWPLWLLITIAAVAGFAQPAFTGGWSAQVRRIVPDMPPARVYAVDVGTYNAGEIAGPALVGLAFIFDSAIPGAASLHAVLLLYIIVVAIMPFLPIPARSVTHDAPAERLGPTLRHLRVMWQSVPLRRSTILGTVSFTAIAFLVVAAPVIGADLAGDAGFGAFLLTSIATGALIGTLVLAKRPIRGKGPGTVAVASTLVLAFLLLGLSASPSIGIAFGIGFFFGAMQAPQLTAIFQVRDRESPTKVRSLVFVASASLRTGSFAIGSLAAGALMVFGWRWVIVGAAILEMLALIIGLVFAPRHRGMPGQE